MNREKDDLSFLRDVKKILTNNYYIIGLVILAVASYGFAITHFAIGIDDFGVKHYMSITPESVGNMLQQGRIIHLMFFYILGVADVIPFFNNFIAVCMLVISVILFCAIIQTITHERFNMVQLFIFSSVYISYSILSFKFIYDIDVVVTMWSYVCTVLSIAAVLKEIKYGKIQCKQFVLGVIFLIFAIGSYEVFITVYICEVLFLSILQYLYANKPVKKIIVEGLKFARNLIFSVLVYYALVKILQVITGNTPYARSNIINGAITVKDSIKSLFARIVQSDLFFTKEFVFFTVIFIIIMLYYVIKEKKMFCLILFPAMGFFVIFVQIIQGYVYYRTCLTFNVFIACVSLLVMGGYNGIKHCKKLS